VDGFIFTLNASQLSQRSLHILWKLNIKFSGKTLPVYIKL